MLKNMSSGIKGLLTVICFALMTTMAPLASHAAEISAGSGGENSVNNINVYDDVINGAVSAVEVKLTGTVAHYAGFNPDMVSFSQWMVLDPVDVSTIDGSIIVDGGEITVYGLGPICYWESMGATRPVPEITTDLEMNAVQVTYGNGEVRYVALSVVTPAYIIVDGLVVEELDTLELRSVAEETYGLPIWLVKNQGKQDSNEEIGGGRYNQ
jgi:hypothetical protein